MYALPLSAEGHVAPRTLTQALPLSGYLFIGVCGALSHVPFLCTTPINWDSVQFELALSHFDLHAHQPHPPGYILYVLAGRAFDLLLGNPSLSLSLLSVLSSTVALPLVVWLSLQIFADLSIALGAALMLLASPMVLYYGSVGLTYAPEMATSVGIACLAWKTRGTERLAMPALLGVSLGLAGGLRQTSLFLLLPVCLFALWKAQRPLWLAFATGLAVACALWFAPLLIMSGGLSAYLYEVVLQAQSASSGTSVLTAGLKGFFDNLAFEATSLVVGLTFGLVPLGIWMSRALRFTLSRNVRTFFLAWIAPSLAFYAVSHMGQFGYALIAMPPLLMLSALCVRVLVRTMNDGRPMMKDEGPMTKVGRISLVIGPSSLVVTLALSALSAGYFVAARGPITASSIRHNNASWTELKVRLREYNPNRTVLLMNSNWSGPFRAAGYLLADFHSYAIGEADDGNFGWLYSAYAGRSTYALPHPPAKPYLPLPDDTETLIILDKETSERLRDASNMETIRLDSGSTIWSISSPEASIGVITIREGKLQLSHSHPHPTPSP